jgi:hypothetical protein
MRRIAASVAITVLVASIMALFLTPMLSAQVTPTTKWANFYGLNSTLDGAPVPVGAVVRAYDPDGIHCGEWTVTTDGVYGMMAVYGDDGTTPGDEDAEEGDNITFTINGVAATNAGPDPATWTWGGLAQVELHAVTGGPTSTSTHTRTPTSTTASGTATHTPTATSTWIPGSVNIRFVPDFTGVAVSGSFYLDVYVDANGQPIDAVDVTANFSSTYLNVQSIERGATLAQTLVETWDNATGSVRYSAGRSFSDPPATGSFILCRIWFQGMASTAGANVTFNPGATVATYLGSYLTVNLFDATVMVGVPTPTATATPNVVNVYIDPSLYAATLGESFDLDVMVAAGAQQLDGVDVTVNYNPSYIQVQSITPGAALSSVNTSTWDNGAGSLIFESVRDIADPAPSGTFLLCTVRFQALANTAGTPVTFNPSLIEAVYLGSPVATSVTDGSVTVGVATATPTRTPTATGTPQNVNLRIDPASHTAALGDTFALQIVADAGAQQVDAIDATIHFNPGYVTVSSVTDGPTLPSLLAKTWDNGAGTLRYAAGRNLADPPPTGTFVLATIYFHAGANTAGTSIQFDGGATDIQFAGGSIVGTLTDGVVIIGSPTATPTVTGVDLRITPSARLANVGDLFSLDVQVEAGSQGVDGADVRITYDQTILTVEGIDSGAALPIQLAKTWDNGSGYLRYAAGRSFVNPPPTGDFALCTIWFRANAVSPGVPVQFDAGDTEVTYLGASVLGNLYDGIVVVQGGTPGTSTATPTSTATATATATTAVATPTPTATFTGGVTPTNEWINVYGQNSFYNGMSLPIGSVVRAYDPDGVNCGIWTVTAQGQYGLMAIYRDDGSTPADEGAQPGDTITFTVNGVIAATTGPDSPVWTFMGDLLHIELNASAAPTSTSTATGAATHTATSTATSTPTGTVVTATPTATHTHTHTPTITQTATATGTATNTPATPTATATQPAGTPVPTNLWVNFYGLNTFLQSNPVPIGAVVRAYDPDGVLCGIFTVSTTGWYGALPVYGDDTMTVGVDEGAESGDTITFTINGIPATPLGPDEPTWTTHGDLRHVELNAEGVSPSDTPTATAVHTATHTPTHTATHTPTHTSTHTPTATVTQTGAPTATATDINTSTPTITWTATPTATGSATATPTATPTIPGGITATNEWVNFYGVNSHLDGLPLPLGAEIRAYDPWGVLCGVFNVTVPGYYGLMAVYRDDPATPADEGASPSDPIHFTINGHPATTMGPDDPIWTTNGALIHVELNASSTGPTATSTATVTGTLPPTHTPTATATATATLGPTSTPTPTATVTATHITLPTWTPTVTATPGNTVTPTNEWVNFYGIDSYYEGAPVPVGSLIRAYDPNGVMCGIFTTTMAGQYGIMAVYRDDPTTPGDEGAQPGDTITFTINGLPATALGPSAALWTFNGDLRHVELNTVAPAGHKVYLPLLARQHPLPPTATPTVTWTATATATRTNTPTFTPTVTRTPTASNTPTITRTPTATHTTGPTSTRTPTATPGGGPGAVYGHVYYDLNSNGAWDSGEPTLAGAVLTLDGTTTYATAADGYYYFGGLAAGHHTLVETNPSGYPVSTTADSVGFDIPTLGATIRYDFGDRVDTGTATLTPTRTITPTPTGTVDCPPPITVDDLDPAFARYGSSYYWHGENAGYNSHMWWTLSNSYTVDNWARWRPTLAAERRYRLEVYIPGAIAGYSPTTSARYMVYHRDGVTPVVINQAANLNQWVSLGEFCFTGDTGGWVELTDATGEAVGARTIAFDAIRWTCVDWCSPTTGTVTATPTVTVMPTYTPTPTATPVGNCYEGLYNTGFEWNGSWSMQGAYPGRYTTDAAHSGSRSGLMGVVPPAWQGEVHSSIYQEITIPWDAKSATLHYWYKPHAQSPHLMDADDYSWAGFTPGEDARLDDLESLAAADGLTSWASEDWQFALIRYGAQGQQWATVMQTNSNAGVWLETTYDLMPFRGQRIYVHFEVRNDGDATNSWMYVDDVSVSICR